MRVHHIALSSGMLALGMLACGPSAWSQSMDDSGQDAEAAQFEDEGRRQPSYPATQRPLSNRDIQDMNQRGRAIEAELEGLKWRIDHLTNVLSRVNSDTFLIAVDRDYWLLPRNELVMQARAKVVLSSDYLFDPARSMSAGADEGQLRLALDRLAANSARNAEAMRQSRARLYARHAELLAQLDRMRRQVMADADRPAQVYSPASPQPAPIPNIGGPWMGNYNRGVVNNIVQSGASFNISLPQLGVTARGTVEGATIQMTSSGRIGGVFTGRITFDSSGRAVQISWSNGDVWVPR